MKLLLTLILLLAAIPSQALTVAQVQQRADDILTPLYTGTWRPAQQAYFVSNRRFAQCLTTNTSVPQNDDLDPSVNEPTPDAADAQLHDQAESCLDVLGGELSTGKPFTLFTDVCEGPSTVGYDDPLSPGRTLRSTFGFRMTIVFEHAGVLYTRSQSYGVDSTGAGANRGCYGGTSTDWEIGPPDAGRTGETGIFFGTILDAAVPQALAIVENCTTGETFVADGSGLYSATFPIGRNEAVIYDVTKTRQRAVTRDVRAGTNLNININLNTAFVGCQ